MSINPIKRKGIFTYNTDKYGTYYRNFTDDEKNYLNEISKLPNKQELPLVEFCMQLRTIQTLKRNGIYTLGELETVFPNELYKIKGVGRKTFEDVMRNLYCVSDIVNISCNEYGSLKANDFDYSIFEK